MTNTRPTGGRFGILKVKMRGTTLAVLALLASSAVSAQTIPRPSPDFVVQFAGGKPLNVSEYRGKVLCLMFILTT